MSDEVIQDGYLEVHYFSPEAPHQTFYLNEVDTWWWSKCGPSHEANHNVERLIVRGRDRSRAEIPAANIRDLKVVPNTKAEGVERG